MKKGLLAILKYFGLFIVTLFLLFVLLVLSMKIPKEKIEKNINESLQFYKDHRGIEFTVRRKEYSYLHYYADSVLLNLVYSVDSDQPIKSAIIDNFYFKRFADINDDFIELVEGNQEPNSQYLRYWHGSMLIIRPLLTFLNIQEIYILNHVVMWSLAIVLLVLLFIKNKKIAFIYLISMIMIVFWFVPKCFEYSWMFHLMFIMSIISILIEKKGNSVLYGLFLISGMLACFLDFLSTEIITIFVPLLFVMFIRKEDNRLNSFKDGFKFLFLSCLLWLMGYVGMWIAKWLLAILVVGKDAINYILPNVMLRINGLQGVSTHKKLYLGAIKNNWYTLLPIIYTKKNTVAKIIEFILLLTGLIVIDWKKIKKKWFSLLILFIGISPYVRYLALANHSYRHFFFTFRSQMITIIAVAIILIDCFNYDFWFKDIKIKNNGEKNGKRINDIDSCSK